MLTDELPSESSDECLGCGATPNDRNTAFTYHRADDCDPNLQSGYLCSVCRQQIEAILTGNSPQECESCGAPLPEAGRMLVMEHDENGVLMDSVTFCSCCLQERY